MNYLAHIQLAHASQTSLLGNFLGDFVKGSNLRHLDEHIYRGVSLHRSIDSFTDSHPIVRGLREHFPSHLRRMSGVMLDVYFDHLLCCHWGLYSKQHLHSVTDEFYAELEQSSLTIPGRYDAVKEGLLQHRWLGDYQQSTACLRAFINIEKRLRHRVIFAQQGYQFVVEHHAHIEEAFFGFYPQLLTLVKSQNRG
ncbi:ACP phosphodiesterase [Glaciecola sp. SC05]|uniref:acyl carrier protein phosphodiesterase n=1 Tax=Glaciecola sp. SC05 TaxID=1987355 RepID=UPI003526FCA5